MQLSDALHGISAHEQTIIVGCTNGSAMKTSAARDEMMANKHIILYFLYILFTLLSLDK